MRSRLSDSIKKMDKAMNIMNPSPSTAEEVRQYNHKPDRCEYAAELMAELALLQEQAASEIRTLLASDNGTERLKLIECWNTQAELMHQQEQLLWKLCDASWYNYGDALRTQLSRSCRSPNEIKIIQEGTTTYLKCPYIPSSEIHKFSLMEDLLMTALSQHKGKHRYRKAHVTFIHVYPVKIQDIPKDVNNHYYRRTIDLLSVFFGFSDAAQMYSMAMTAAFTDTIPGGSYIVLEEQEKAQFQVKKLELLFSSKS